MPVDIATGTVRLEYDDVAIPGKVALALDRRYSTGRLDQPSSAFGLGWTCRFFATLTFTDGRFEFFTPQGGVESFADAHGAVAKGEVVRNLGACLEIFRQDRRCIVQSWNVESGEVLRYGFTPGATAEPWRLQSIEDVRGQGLDLSWSEGGQLVTVRQRLEKRELQFTYNRAGLIDTVSLRAPNGQQHTLMRYVYDEQGRQVEARDAADFADRFEYDRAGRVTREIAKDGGIFHYRYDLQGRCVLRSGLNHYNEKRLRYVDGVRVTEVTDSYGQRYTYMHLPTGQAVLEVDPQGGRSTTQYDEHGRVLAKTDPMGGTTRYAYDEHGNRSAIINALGHTTRLSHNEQHLPLSMTDANGQVWRRAYDAGNRVIATTDPLGHSWRFAYDAEGNVCEVVNPVGARKLQRFEGGILRAVTDWQGQATHFEFDAFGRVLERRGPLGETTRFRYDPMGNPVQVQLPDGGILSATFDHAGNLTQFIDAGGQTTRWRYGPCSRLMERTDPNGGTVRYEWGSETGRLDAVVNERGEIYRFTRDDMGQVVEEQSFDGVRRLFTYDAAGRVSSLTNGKGETIRVQRDALHQLVGQTLPDGTQQSYVFDPVGVLVQAAQGEAVVVFERDPRGSIVREVQGDHWVANHYDPVGDCIRTETSLGHVVSREYDANGLLARVTTCGQSIDLARDAQGRETLRRMPGGVRMEQAYDRAGRLVGQRVLGPDESALVPGRGAGIPPERELIRRSYAYNRNGTVTRIEDGYWGWASYEHDPAERLLGVLRERGASESFDYDVTGNVTQIRVEGTQASAETLVYGPGSRLLQKGSTRYEYDADGRRIAKIEPAPAEESGASRIWRYEWNALGQLAALVRPDGQVWRYTYDALGRRIRKQRDPAKGLAPQPALRFIWNGGDLLHEAEQRGDAWHSLAAWVRDPATGVPLATEQHGSLCSVVVDHMGTPRELVDSRGQVARTLPGGAWGKAEAEETIYTAEGAPRYHCPLGFMGQYFDTESGLAYNYFRYYDSATASYISQDPIRLNGGNNLYKYVVNPIKWTDPLGLTSPSCTNRGRGYIVYHITDGGEPPTVLYVGITESHRFETRQDEHTASGRLSGDREMVIAERPRTYGEARGLEQAHIDHYETRNTDLIGHNSRADYEADPANRVNSYDTSRTDARARAFERARVPAAAAFGD